MSVTLGFIIGIVGWLYILGEVYAGEAARANIPIDNAAKIIIAIISAPVISATVIIFLLVYFLVCYFIF
jgi:hypothetical protein